MSEVWLAAQDLPEEGRCDELLRRLLCVSAVQLQATSLTQAVVLHLADRRKDSFKAFNEGFVHLTGLLESLYGLSGHPRWSRLVRASRQQKGLLMSVMKRRRAARARRGQDDEPTRSLGDDSRE